MICCYQIYLLYVLDLIPILYVVVSLYMSCLPVSIVITSAKEVMFLPGFVCGLVSL